MKWVRRMPCPGAGNSGIWAPKGVGGRVVPASEPGATLGLAPVGAPARPPHLRGWTARDFRESQRSLRCKREAVGGRGLALVLAHTCPRLLERAAGGGLHDEVCDLGLRAEERLLQEGDPLRRRHRAPPGSGRALCVAIRL